jgi:hypothetical protein
MTFVATFPTSSQCSSRLALATAPQRQIGGCQPRQVIEEASPLTANGRYTHIFAGMVSYGDETARHQVDFRSNI